MKNKETIITLLIVFSLPLQFPLIQFYFFENLYIGEYIFLIGLFIIDKKKFSTNKKINFNLNAYYF